MVAGGCEGVYLLLLFTFGSSSVVGRFTVMFYIFYFLFLVFVCLCLHF